jgi:PleD family two-component response regulator
LHILVAEDDPVSRKLLSRTIERWGHQVTEVSNGAEALAMVQQRRIRLVITDWMMPTMDGADFCRAVRRANLDYYVYIIMVTALGEKHNVIRGMAAGADDYITKPINRNELYARLRAGMRVLHLEDNLRTTTARLRDLATVDPELEVSNRESLEMHLAREMSRSAFFGQPLAFARVLLSLEEEGELLRSLARLAAVTLRPFDGVGRLAAMELGLIMPGLESEGAGAQMAELCGAMRVEADRSGKALEAVKIGLCTIRPSERGGAGLCLERSRKALARASEAPGDRLVIFDGDEFEEKDI